MNRQLLLLGLWLTMVGCQNYNSNNGLDFVLERPKNLPSITQLEVMCGKDHMTVQIAFSTVFQGMVFSKGQYGQPNCIYVQPFSSGAQFEFKIYYNKCGTKPDLGGRFYENTIIVQYDADLIEVWDEAKRLRCEWFNDYEKTASKPPMVIADLEVVELNFRGDNVDCWMEIQDGKGPWASQVTGIVPLGSTLTMVIAINDKSGEFDMRVKSCEASDGSNRPIFLSDENGCVLRPKMISKFLKLRNNDGRASVLTYAHFHAFKFPDSMAVHMRCKVEICRYGCPDHCQRSVAGYPADDFGGLGSGSENVLHHEAPSAEFLRGNISAHEQLHYATPREVPTDTESAPVVVRHTEAARDYLSSVQTGNEFIELPQQQDFPWGPRSLRKRREVSDDTTPQRRRREVVLDRNVRETNIGVTTDFQVISEADLEFTLPKDEGVTVFQGQREEIVYGICLPAPGFSALFVLLAMCTVISVLVAGFMCHHRQIQKDCVESPAAPHPTSASRNMIHFFRAQLVGAH